MNALTPDEVPVVVGQVGRTLHAVLNAGGPTRWGFVLIVAEINIPTQDAHIATNLTEPSVALVLKEASARYEGRLSPDVGKA